jgi:hypothetical protein
LEEAWELWLHWGEHKNGERQRSFLCRSNRLWVKRCRMYKELQRNLHGTEAEKKRFKAKMLAVARAGMKEDVNWEIWDEYVDWHNYAVRVPVRDCHIDGYTEDTLLGRRIYKRQHCTHCQ